MPKILGVSTDPAGTDLWTPQPSFGDRLRMVRRGMKMSQAQFAELIGDSSKNVATWEADKSLPRHLVAVCKKIELAARVPSEWLLGLHQQSAPLPPDGPRIKRGWSETAGQTTWLRAA